MIEVKGLSKSFGPIRAVRDVSFTVTKGEILGFLGPNGAGKSTTMRMITGYVPPSDGKVTVGGHDAWEDQLAARRLIGYLPENAPLYTDMTVRAFLEFVADLRGFDGARKKQAVDRSIETCSLQRVVHQQIETLSKGYRHRTCLAQAILHDPPVLIMDEPTDGLDPNQKQEVRTLIRRMGAEKTIIFSTHILEEVEAACTRAIIIDRGQIVANGTPGDLKRKAPTAGAVVLRVTGVAPEAVEGALKGVGTVKAQAEGGAVVARIEPKAGARSDGIAGEVFEIAKKSGWSVRELHTEEGRLDEVFRAITRPDTVK
ncbi:MAG TPA: ATP-binding cassette domain-containing protein [Verrucomicrobiae bacterium]|nr:ATP-binding cassette domain-containing protein [Verrucomicrobiae bacterium]